MIKALLGIAILTVTAGSSFSATENQNRELEDIGLKLIWVNPGSFVMGSDSDEELRDPAEGPRTHVTISKGFWLAETEVTQAQYQAIVGTNPSHFKDAGGSIPVEEVSWDDAMAFCSLLNAREGATGRLPRGYKYTLPTEAQWEYACRAATVSAYPGNPEEMGWYEANSRETTHPVAQLKPNAWGFYDMSGNVLEWCLDWYGKYPGGKSVDPIGPKRGHFRMARGGSWRIDIGVMRSAARAGGSQGRRDYTIGFRLALCPSVESP